MEQTQLEQNTPIYERSDKGPVLYIRHGKTQFNVVSEVRTSENPYVLTKYIDSPLNDEGIEQSKNLANALKGLKIKYAFTSPLERCIQTAYYSLREHPDVANITVFVHHELTETVNGSQDYSKDIKNKKEKYSSMEEGLKFDWSLFDQEFIIENDKENYFFKYVDNAPEDKKEECRVLVEKIKAMGSSEERDKLLMEWASHYHERETPERPESLNMMRKRGYAFKEFIKSKLADLKEDEKILIFTHSSYIRLLTSKEAIKEKSLVWYPKDAYKPENCEIVTLHL
jgi:broad specificity phosphatase PhoE